MWDEPAASGEPERKGEVRIYPGGRWWALSPKEPVDDSNPIGSLDVSILHDRLLAPMLGIGTVERM